MRRTFRSLIYSLFSIGNAAAETPQYPAEVLRIAEQIGYEPDMVAKARALSPPELEALTEKYVRESHQSPSYWELKPAADLAADYLIAVVARPDAFKSLPNQMIELKESPGSRALDFLPKGQSKALIPVLKKWAQTGDNGILSRIGYHVAAY
jgi:hypothetical protein